MRFARRIGPVPILKREDRNREQMGRFGYARAPASHPTNEDLFVGTPAFGREVGASRRSCCGMAEAMPGLGTRCGSPAGMKTLFGYAQAGLSVGAARLWQREVGALRRKILT